jgi:hypothetical protein
LKDAESAYDQALPLYRTIEDRLGEANTLKGMANLALSEQRLPAAFDLLCQALRLAEDVQDALGAAGTRGYMARVAFAAARPLHAAVLGARAWRMLAAIESLYGQTLALQEMARAWAALERPEDSTAAMLLAWALAEDIGAPLAAQLREATGQEPPSLEQRRGLEQAVERAADADEEALRERGEDPEAPWA